MFVPWLFCVLGFVYMTLRCCISLVCVSVAVTVGRYTMLLSIYRPIFVWTPIANFYVFVYKYVFPLILTLYLKGGGMHPVAL
jgi:hypothetical protein